ncbi:Uncharacterised protein (plasmid) [Tsukamurella tyrosinosolvens]|uniref:Uncharacterized protein n=1 Tax=Tsukamurella tyrosinosolvens TaxID=57704 RepID=A0A1H4V5Q9_TSUTY|nr:hypothetical protein [Tsukamurella tyrosinosolvens]KXO91043.1 hypothetical protein AXK58_21675 [Tsukamurella tyrosinosolvens]SEC76200.1 hypothetical protein SAMN04489793_3147 [Tsukamurella tyrosinosolvens]VEH90676.1 Uncharacterised protein [Tsukamurella tyrosinosolvens]
MSTQLEDLLHLQIRDDDRRLVKTRRGCSAAARELDRCADALHRLLGSERVRLVDDSAVRWNRTTREVLDLARAAVNRVPYAKKQQIMCALTAAAAAERRVTELTAALMRMETRHVLRGGWWRFYAEEDNTLHTSDECARLRLRRGHAQLVPDLSGTDAYELRRTASVEHLCPGCFSTSALRTRKPRGLQDAA